MADKKSSPGLIAPLYLIFFAILPMVYVKSLVDYSLIPRQMVLSVFVLVLIPLSWKAFSSGGRFVLSGAAIAFGALLAIALASSFVAINRVESWATISRLGAALAYFLLTVQLLQTGKLKVQSLVKGVTIFAVIASGITLFELMKAVGSGDFFSDIYTVRGTFSHKNLLSSALLLCLPFLIMGSVILEKMWKGLSLVLIVLIIAEIFILRTRGVWVSVIVASGITAAAFFAYRKRSESGSLKFPVRLVSILSVIAVLLLVGLFSAPGLKEQFSSKATLDKRMVFWRNSVEMIKEKPITGVGAGNWKIYFPKYGIDGIDPTVNQGITHIQRPHSDYLWVMSEMGIPGFLAFMAFFVFALIRVRKNLSADQSREELIVDLSLLFGLIGYLVFSIADFPMERTSHMVLMMSMVALAYRKQLQGKTVGGSAIAVLSAVLVLFSIMVASQRWSGEKASTEILGALAGRNAQGMVSASEDALNDFYNMDNYANPIYYYSAVGKLVQKNAAGAKLDIDEARKIHPYNIIVLSQTANVLKEQGKLNEALEFYLKALDISPQFEMAAINIAEIEYNKRNYSESLFYLNRVHFNSQNKKYIHMVAFTIKKIVENYQGTNKHQKLIRIVTSRNPQSEQDYYDGYIAFRRQVHNELTNGG